jgi:hypothetical protein
LVPTVCLLILVTVANYGTWYQLFALPCNHSFCSYLLGTNCVTVTTYLVLTVCLLILVTVANYGTWYQLFALPCNHSFVSTYLVPTVCPVIKVTVTTYLVSTVCPVIIVTVTIVLVPTFCTSYISRCSNCQHFLFFSASALLLNFLLISPR